MVLRDSVFVSGLLITAICVGTPAGAAHESSAHKRQGAAHESSDRKEPSTAHEIGERAPQPVAQETFLGFRVGEEIRYALESEDGGQTGMHAQWGVRLEEFDRSTGVFALTYEAGIPSGPAGAGPAQGGTLIARTTATAWVNAYGFPIRVRLTTQRNTPLGGIEYTVEYRYEDRRFIKELEGSGKDQEAKLDDFPIVDRDAPAGMYLFMPAAAECLFVAPQASGNRSGGASPAARATGSGSAAGARGDVDPPCGGREPVFANPGLLNLTMPALWESGTGTLEFLAMAPTGVLARVLLGPGNPAGSGSGISVGGYSLLGGGGPNPFGDAEDPFGMLTLTAENELMQLDVGGRPVDVWRLRASAPLESVYVDGSGSIVRLDLPADPESGERLWIRRLRPSEY